MEFCCSTYKSCENEESSLNDIIWVTDVNDILRHYKVVSQLFKREQKALNVYM